MQRKLAVLSLTALTSVCFIVSSWLGLKSGPDVFDEYLQPRTGNEIHEPDNCTAHLWSFFEMARNEYLSGGGSFYATDWWPIAAKLYSTSYAFDVGANTGLYSMGLLKEMPGIDIFMFEGNPVLHPTLRDLAQQHPQLHLIPLAVSNKTGVIYFGGSGTGGHIYSHGGEDTTKVNVTTLSNFVLDKNTAPGTSLGAITGSKWPLKNRTNLIIKIDTEGYDLDILDGMRRLLSSSVKATSPQVKVIQAEYNPRSFCDRFHNFSRYSFQQFKCEQNQRFWRSENNLLLQMTEILREFGYLTFLSGPVFVPLNPVADVFSRTKHVKPMQAKGWPPSLSIGTGDIVAVLKDDVHTTSILEQLSPCPVPSGRVPKQDLAGGIPFQERMILRLHDEYGFGDLFLYPFQMLSVRYMGPGAGMLQSVADMVNRFR